jgi:hypothetical protein
VGKRLVLRSSEYIEYYNPGNPGEAQSYEATQDKRSAPTATVGGMRDAGHSSLGGLEGSWMEGSV